MLFSVILPLFIGVLGVLQNTWNKKIAEVWGLPLTLIWNNIVLLSVSLVAYVICRSFPLHQQIPSLRASSSLENLGWRHLAPGMVAYVIILLVPITIERSGALLVFLGIVVAQIATGMLWDLWVESIAITPVRAAGALLAVAGAYLASR